MTPSLNRRRLHWWMLDWRSNRWRSKRNERRVFHRLAGQGTGGDGAVPEAGVGGGAGFGQNLPSDVELSEEQITQLEKLKEETTKSR